MTKKHPRISRYVTIYHPDLQGPMDVCELLWGSAIFLDLVDHPDMVQALLTLITETYIRFMRRWNEVVPGPAGYAVHWQMMHKGTIMLRDDSAMNLSPQMFEEFIEPYDRRLLREFRGGAFHFCGRGDHYIHRLPEMGGVNALALSQPEYNDMERVFRYTVDRGIRLLALPRKAAEEALSRGRNLHGSVHCW
jgi:uroporphyrinogen-III decarboxylase